MERGTGSFALVSTNWREPNETKTKSGLEVKPFLGWGFWLRAVHLIKYSA